MPTRKPKVSLQRSAVKPAGKPKEKPKPTEKPNATHPKPDNPRKETTKPDEETLPTTGKEEEWQPVSTKHLLRSDTNRKEIQRILPLLESFIKKNGKSNTNKIPQWQITKFRELKHKIDNTEPAKLKARDN